jgi:hypothetical protein
MDREAKNRRSGTRQVNLALTAAQEEIVRLLVLRLREGGVEYEERVRGFIQEAPEPQYMHVDELDRRFGAIERRLLALEARPMPPRGAQTGRADGAAQKNRTSVAVPRPSGA